MCLVLFSYQPDSSTPLVIAANRDEFYARPATSAHYWPTAEHLLAGRDLSAGGTWLGISTTRRFATVTNFAEDAGEAAPRSRGELVETFLTGSASAHEFAHHIHGQNYRGFNLLLWDGAALVYTSNRGTTQDLAAGVYGLANAELGATWPKVVRGVDSLAEVVAAGPNAARLLTLLGDNVVPADRDLPRRGRPIELERRVAPIFISGEDYGTRASSALVIGESSAHFAEQSFNAGGGVGGLLTFDVNFEQA